MKIACYIHDASVFDEVKSALLHANHEVLQVDGETGMLRAIRREGVDMVLVDVESEQVGDGRAWPWLACHGSGNTPVIVLSPSRDAGFVAHVLDSGADDFISRPFYTMELTARIGALYRRWAPQHVPHAISFAGYTLDRDNGRVAYADQVIALTPREFSMAWLLFSSPGVYISRETIGAVIWSADREVAGRTIEQHIYKLRKKLQAGPGRAIMIRTSYAQGYRLERCDADSLA